VGVRRSDDPFEPTPPGKGASTVFCPNRECPDVEESGAPGEYREGIVLCPKCGTRLVPERPVLAGDEEPGAEGAEEQDAAVGPLVAVASFNYHQDADLVASMLLANGVQAVIFADDCGGTDPRIGFGSRTRVMVPEGQARLALALLEPEAGDPD
jgi:hypothetical protein